MGCRWNVKKMELVFTAIVLQFWLKWFIGQVWITLKIYKVDGNVPKFSLNIMNLHTHIDTQSRCSGSYPKIKKNLYLLYCNFSHLEVNSQKKYIQKRAVSFDIFHNFYFMINIIFPIFKYNLKFQHVNFQQAKKWKFIGFF